MHSLLLFAVSYRRTDLFSLSVRRTRTNATVNLGASKNGESVE